MSKVTNTPAPVSGEKKEQPWQNLEVPLERRKAIITIVSDGSARICDSFGYGDDYNAATVDTKKSHQLVLTARPLPLNMIRSSCIVKKSVLPVFAYRVDQPVWASGSGTALSHAALGELLSLQMKHASQNHNGTCIHADRKRIVLYNVTNRTATIVGKEHITAITVKEVDPSNAAFYDGTNLCLLDVRFTGKKMELPPKDGTTIVELSYDLKKNAMSFCPYHILWFDGVKNTMRIATFVQIANNTGIHLLHAVVKIKQKKSDAERSRYQSREDNEEDHEEEEEEDEKKHRHKSQFHKMAVLSRAMPEFALSSAVSPPPQQQQQQQAPSSQSTSDAVIEVRLNAEKESLHLVSGSKTKINALDVEDVPVMLQYLLNMSSIPYDSSPMTSWSLYEYSSRRLTFDRADLVSKKKDSSLLSGPIVVQDVLSDDAPLSDVPSYLDAWQNLSSNRMIVDLGQNGGMRWRYYIERQIVDQKKSTRTQVCRCDVMIIPGAIPGKLSLKFGIQLEQPSATEPRFLGCYRRKPLARDGEEGDREGAFIYSENEDLFLVKHNTWQKLEETDNLSFKEHVPDTDDQPMDHLKRDLLHDVTTLQEDIEVYQKFAFPLLLSYYYQVNYVVAVSLR